MADEGTKLHETPGLTRERSYEKLRETGVTHDTARRIADDAARQTHDKLNKR